MWRGPQQNDSLAGGSRFDADLTAAGVEQAAAVGRALAVRHARCGTLPRWLRAGLDGQCPWRVRASSASHSAVSHFVKQPPCISLPPYVHSILAWVRGAAVRCRS